MEGVGHRHLPGAAGRPAHRAQRRHLPLPAAAVVPLPQGLHDATLPGKLLLQVDEVSNIGAAVRERYNGNDGASRCLKLLLTDGGCCVLGAAGRPPNATGAQRGGSACLPAGT